MGSAVDDSTPQIATKLVGAQPVTRLGGQALGAGETFQRVISGKQLRDNGHQRSNDHNRPGQQQAGLEA